MLPRLRRAAVRELPLGLTVRGEEGRLETGRKFVIFTGGRCGSTAVAAELANHPRIICYGELFRRASETRPDFRENYEKFGVDFFSPDEKQFIRYAIYAEQHLSHLGCAESAYHSLYLRYLSERADGFRPGAAIGFKLLYRHPARETGLLETLKEEGFAFLHLTRRNIVRQTISGMIAKKRGFYNKKNWDMPSERFHLDIENFKTKLRSKRKRLRKNTKLLQDTKVDFIEIYYEDYARDRTSFLAPIFSFLGVDNRTVPPSDWSVMTGRDLRNIIENYDDLRQATKALNLEEMLETA